MITSGKIISPSDGQEDLTLLEEAENIEKEEEDPKETERFMKMN